MEMSSNPDPKRNQSSDTSSTTETFTIHYFATASQYTGNHSEQLPAPLPLARLFPVLEERYPGIQERVLRSCGLSLDGEYVDVDVESEGGRVIGAGAEIAVIPPVSSG